MGTDAMGTVPNGLSPQSLASLRSEPVSFPLRHPMTPRILALLAVVILSNVAGNFALTWGMKHAPASAGPLTSLYEPAAILGIALLIVWTLIRMKLLEVADLSFVLPVTAVGYVLNTVAGVLFLNEHVSPQRWTGTLLIVAGAALTSLTSSSEEDPA